MDFSSAAASTRGPCARPRGRVRCRATRAPAPTGRRRGPGARAAPNAPGEPGKVTPFRMPVERETLTLPVMGEIAAGQPIEAYEDAAETLAVPASMDARADSYVLRVRGKSMIDALIDDGDFVIVQPQA